MMGHIQMLLIGMVQKHHGEEGVQKLFELANLPKQTFRTEVIYPDEQFQSLYAATKKLYGVDDETAQKAFSDYFVEVSPKMFPAIFKEAKNARGLFERVPIIHKQWPSAASMSKYKERISVLVSEKDRLVYKYESPNNLCGVLRHVAEGFLSYYKESGVVSETQCARRGAQWCEVEIRFKNPNV